MTAIDVLADLRDISSSEDFYDRETVVRRVVGLESTKIACWS